MLDPREIEFRELNRPDRFATIIEANWKLRWQCRISDSEMMSRSDRAAVFHHARQKAMSGLWQSVYGDLREPFHEMLALAARSEHVRTEDLSRLRDVIRQTLYLP